MLLVLKIHYQYTMTEFVCSLSTSSWSPEISKSTCSSCNCSFNLIFVFAVTSNVLIATSIKIRTSFVNCPCTCKLSPWSHGCWTNQIPQWIGIKARWSKNSVVRDFPTKIIEWLNMFAKNKSHWNIYCWQIWWASKFFNEWLQI